MSGGIPYVISLKAVSSASSFSRSSAVGGNVPSSAPRACSAGVAILAAVVRTCGPTDTTASIAFVGGLQQSSSIQQPSPPPQKAVMSTAATPLGFIDLANSCRTSPTKASPASHMYIRVPEHAPEPQQVDYPILLTPGPP
ncbi:hypothetical protein LXL04_038487 [Taraxacum kok-saghyz]